MHPLPKSRYLCVSVVRDPVAAYAGFGRAKKRKVRTMQSAVPLKRWGDSEESVFYRECHRKQTVSTCQCFCSGELDSPGFGWGEEIRVKTCGKSARRRVVILGGGKPYGLKCHVNQWG